MKTQSKKIYSSLITRIAVSLLINQALLSVLSSILSVIEGVVENFFLGNDAVDVIFMFFKCVVYALGFCVPIVVFNLMGKTAEPEIYTPESTERLPNYMIPFAIGAGLGATVLAANVNHIVINAFSDYSEFTQQYFWDADLSTTPKAIAYFIYIAVIPAVVEELLFRWTICRSLRTYGRGTAIFVSAILFSLMHTNAEQLIYTFVAGVMLAWIYVETENIILPMLLHFINNGLSAALEIVYARGSVSDYNSFSNDSDLVIWIFSAVSLVAFLVYIARRGKVFTPTVMKPDENGEPVALLSRADRVSGFFTPMMIIFIAYSIIVMVYYFALSFILM